MQEPDFEALLEKYHKGECSPEELDMIESWYLHFNQDWESLSPQELEREVAMMTEYLSPQLFHKDHGPSILHRSRLPLSVAAAILIVVGIGYLFLPKKSEKQNNIAHKIGETIVPGRQTASLTLANGKKIVLSDANSGELANETGVTITKTSDGELIYQVGNLKSATSGVNTLSTANGETYRVKLPDGSMVWLNSASSLKYPVSFHNSAKRVVQLSGEAYFEIEKDNKHPFIVQSQGQQVEVLGTHFNVNAYHDEPGIMTTLLEGRIRLRPERGTAKLLKPGQQSQLTDSGIKISNADTRSAMAWKDGYFHFRNESLQSVMRKISRWYNVEVIFQKGLPEDTYTGSVTRYGDINQVLEIIESANNIHFNIKERRIIISK